MTECRYPNCIRDEHTGLHEFPWGGSIPWPPEADNIEEESDPE